ncbi:hypothetical protein UT300012_21820 [Paraclostridium bifermentans]
MRIVRCDINTVEAIELLPQHICEEIMNELGIKEDRVLLNMKFNNKGKVKGVGLVAGNRVYIYSTKTLEQNKEIKMYMELMKFSVKEFLKDVAKLERQETLARKIWKEFENRDMK